MAQTSAVRSTSTTLLRAFQVLAALAVLNVLYQFVTAGQLVSGNAPVDPHGAGAIALHVLSGLTAVTAVLLWRSGQVARGLAIQAVVVFLFTFLQAYLGSHGSLTTHVPGAMLLTAGVTWVLVAALRAGRR